MRRDLLFLLVFHMFSLSLYANPASLLSLTIENSSVAERPAAATRLNGRDARLQLLVAGKLPDGSHVDATHSVTYTTHPEGILAIDASGLATPLANGNVTVTATDDSGTSATTTIAVLGMEQNAPVSFATQVVPIFTKLGCNGGGCHGKSAGQNGFRLSLLGFDPRADYEHIVKESRGRRASLAAPDQSLLLLKAINASPHGGGQRLEKDSHEYRLMRRWVATGMPYGTGNEPTVQSIEVYPQQRRLEKNSKQQLTAIAHFSDGSTEDITRAAVFESNDTEMAEVSATGLVQLKSLVGDVSVMARYQGHVDVFRADIPLGATDDWPETKWPEQRNVVDRYVFGKLKSLGIPPAGECDDATYLRRVTLDIAGRLPTLAEVTAFEKSAEPAKRTKLVDRLLDSDDYASFFARKWITILRNRRTGGELQLSTIIFHQWVRESLRRNAPYDEFVRELVSAAGSPGNHPPVLWLKNVSDRNQRIEDTAQAFLGQRIQCARCHHHPYEKWSQKHYAQMTAFFGNVHAKGHDDPGERRFFFKVQGVSGRHPKTGQNFRPAGLDGDEISIPDHEDPRAYLADWMTSADNPFFARMLVNRYWKHFMGRGLVEPEDDMRVTNPPSNPDLLDGLAHAFVASGYDLQELVRLICNSRTYAAAADANQSNLGDRRSYSRFYPRRMQAEVLLDAVDTVTGNVTEFASMPTGTRAIELPDTGFQSYFLNVFGQPAGTTACECERMQEANLAQSLHLLNSEQMQKKLSGEQARAAKLAADPRAPEAKVTELYRIAFSRSPSPKELANTVVYLEEKQDRHKAYEDLVWSLVNSKEFMFNH